MLSQSRDACSSGALEISVEQTESRHVDPPMKYVKTKISSFPQEAESQDKKSWQAFDDK